MRWRTGTIRLVCELADDASDLIGAAQDLDLDESQGDAVGLLGLVAGQDVESAGVPGRWRIARGTAKGRVISVVDPESRHTHKTSHSYRDGYKAHTGLVTAPDLTAGDVGNADAAMGLLQDEPTETVVLADSAYGTGQLRADLQQAQMDAVIKPPPLSTAVEGSSSVDDFDNDYSINPHSGEFSFLALYEVSLTRLTA